MTDGDGVEEALDGGLRTALAVASRLAEQALRSRGEAARLAEAASTQQAREYQVRFDAERHVARAELAPALEGAWWDRAGVNDIARAHETATVWSVHDELAGQARTRILEEVQARYGVDIGNLGVDPAGVIESLARAESGRQIPGNEKARKAPDQAESVRLLTHADHMDEHVERGRSQRVSTQGLRDGAVGAWDSAARRDAHVSSLAGKATKESIDAWRQADSDSAKHPREAVRRAGSSIPKARRLNADENRQRQRGRER